MSLTDEEIANRIPKFDELFNPTIQAIRDLGGSGSIEEIVDKLIQIMELPEEVADFAHLGSHTQTALGYRAAWARTYLKKAGILENSSRGVWSLTDLGRSKLEVNPKDIAKRVRETEVKNSPDEEEEEATVDWREELVGVMKAMEPDAFERLCQRVLREGGFVEVEVTQRGADGGIDGKGLVRLQGLLSFPIVFQCKRYKESVGNKIVRDFRGAMSGRADRGLIMTTGRFTKDAHEEARRDGVNPIDLIDGRELAEKVREYGLGVDSTEHVSYDVEIDREWFATL